MLTYRTGSHGGLAGAHALVEHLLEPTIPHEIAALASYYALEPADATAVLRCTIPRLRKDLDPDVSHLLGVGHALDPNPTEFANLLAGMRADGGSIRGRAPGKVEFIDICISSDKTLSICWALAQTEAERALIHRAHQDAVASTMIFVETIIGRARRGKGGRGGSEPGRIGWITCDHVTSRPTVQIALQDKVTNKSYTALATVRVAGDPQIHTHNLVPSTVLTASGHVGHLHLNQLRGRVHELGALYQAFVATNLRAIGIEVVLDPKTGAARIANVPEVVRAAFSKRTAAGEASARAFAASQNLVWDEMEAAQRVALLKAGTQGDPRAPKTDDLGNLAAWKAQADALGWQPGPIANPASPQPLPNREKRMEIARSAAAPILAQAFRRQAVLDVSIARIAAARGLVASGIEDPEEIGEVAKALIEGGFEVDGILTSVISCEVRGQGGRTFTRITTAEHVEREARVISLAASAASDRSASLTFAEIDAAAAASGLDLSGAHGCKQVAAMHALGAGGRVNLLVGAAGAGKTTILGPLVSAWSAQKRLVYGTANAWRQAEALTDTGIPSERCLAIAALLARAQSGDLCFNPDDVILVDEASLVSTRAYLELLQLREVSGATLIAVGDPLQGRAIEAGGVIDLLGQALGGSMPEVSTTVRQRTKQERSFADMTRLGHATPVVEALRKEGRARLAPGTRTEALEAVASLWEERVGAVGEAQILVLTPTRADARDVGAAIRLRRKEAGKVGQDLVAIDAVDQSGSQYELNVAIGDRVRLFGRVYAHGSGKGVLGSNGSILEVRGTNKQGIVLRAANGRQGIVEWASLREPETGRVRLDQGYVSTIDTGQGATAEESILALVGGSTGMDAARYYVAASRHRSTSWIILGEGAERQAVAKRRALNDTRPIRAADLWSYAAANFSRRPESEGALELLERARATRHQAKHGFLIGLALFEARRARGLPLTVVPALQRQSCFTRAVKVIAHLARERARALVGLVDHFALTVGRRPRLSVEAPVPTKANGRRS